MKYFSRVSFLLAVFALITSTIVFSNPGAKKTIRIATWNIEHLGSDGRGFGGIGAGKLPPRSEKQLKNIALFIQNELNADLLAIQEVGVTSVVNGKKISAPLEKIIKFLGPTWTYHIGSSGHKVIDPVHNMHNAFIWNKSVIHGIQFVDFNFPNEIVGNKGLYDRRPLIGYFEIMAGGNARNDFLLTNIHLTAGQNNDENHLAAMIILEQNMKYALKKYHIKESDRIILGDFNDNPYATGKNGKPKYMNLMYQYMNAKKYVDLVTKEVGATRMDGNLTSIIDHILVNNSARKHLSKNKPYKYMPGTDEKELAKWRYTYSDHFPIVFEIKVEKKDDDVD